MPANVPMLFKTYRDPRGDAHAPQNVWLEEEEYKRVLAAMPIPTADTVLFSPADRVIFLAKRCVEPAKEPWHIGGRIQTIDASLEDAAMRLLKEEVGLVVEKERLMPLGVVLFSWNKVKQGNFGGKNLSTTFALAIHEEERSRAARALAPGEYDVSFGLQPYDKARLEQEGCHPVLHDCYHVLFS
jgi:8-oxo-dGTP pyrophosphatase MutT (NUDIX family)